VEKKISENLPFVCKPLETMDNEYELPNFLNFEATIDKDTGLIYQKADKLVDECLTKSYRSGTFISGLMSDEGNGKLYAEDFLNFIEENYGDVTGKKILEIGCGSGYLLHRLNKLGAETIGIEPGNSHKTEHDKYCVDVIDDFFPSKKVQDKFDIILFYGVLEHIKDVNEFLSSLKENLKDNGSIILAVPDCENYIKFGDISMFFHEHYNYFTKCTLNFNLAKSQFIVKHNKKSGYGGLIYALAENSNEPLQCEYPTLLNADKYFTLLMAKNEEIKNMFKNHSEDNIGIYTPGRAINVLAVIKDDITMSNIRFFDDNPILRGKYYPGFDIKIESKEDFYNKPTDVTFIMSHSFEDKIYENIYPYCKKIYRWSDIFNENSKKKIK